MKFSAKLKVSANKSATSPSCETLAVIQTPQNMTNLISKFFQSALVLVGLQSCGGINTTTNFQNGQKNLVVFSDYGSNTDTVIENVGEDQIKDIMDKIDWNSYHMVYIERNVGEMIGVLGLLKDDGTTPPGLTSTWDEQGTMLVMKNDPKTVEDLTRILISYLKDDKELKNEYE